MNLETIKFAEILLPNLYQYFYFLNYLKVIAEILDEIEYNNN